jgi:ribonuclease HII
MLQMHEKYPQYGFDKHKGYGTKLHMEALNQSGPCEIHRQSFEPMPTLAKKR